MPYDGEAIQAALFARLKAQFGSQIKKSSRRALTFADVPKDHQPCMVLVKERETADRNYGVPTRWTCLSTIAFYVQQPNDPEQTIETQLHAMLKTVDAALKRQPTDGPLQEDNPETTLGGLVFRCFRHESSFDQVMGEGGGGIFGVIETVAPE